MDTDKIIIVQNDRTILVETNNAGYPYIRDELIKFAELIKTPEYYHTYQITKISLWNAASLGITSSQVIQTLTNYSKYPVPPNIQSEIYSIMGNYGSLVLEKSHIDDHLLLVAKNPDDLRFILKDNRIKDIIVQTLDENKLLITNSTRGMLKQTLALLGYPVKDMVGYIEGEKVDLSLKPSTKEGTTFALRNYQQEAIKCFYQDGSPNGGSGNIILPCGAGKTIVGLGIITEIKQATLIICSSTVAVKQWIQELCDKTSIDVSSIGEYTGESKDIRPITVTTYQILTYHKRNQNKLIASAEGSQNGQTFFDETPTGSDDFPHFNIFDTFNWGLIIYDEVHLLPAPLFRITANLQSTRRLGLTATLIREDGHETDVFSLIGPVRYNVPWLVLQDQGWLANAQCMEIRVPFEDQYRIQYLEAPKRVQYRIAAENPLKLLIMERILAKHANDAVLIIAQYIEQLKNISHFISNVPIISGTTPNRKRIALYNKFESGEIRCLIVSKVANYAIDLPRANVMIQLSGTFGSRQEEAQRLGRILRPNKYTGVKQAYFYTIVTQGTVDEEYANHRQLFLVEQGYSYKIEHASL